MFRAESKTDMVLLDDQLPHPSNGLFKSVGFFIQKVKKACWDKVSFRNVLFKQQFHWQEVLHNN